MSAPSSYKPSDMVQSMKVKVSTFTQQFTQTEINNLALGKNNQIHLTNPAMVNHIRNSNLSSLTPSIEITPKYTTLNQQSSGGPGNGEPPAIANAGALSQTSYNTTYNFTEFTDMVNGSSTYGQTITFASTQSVITCIAVDSSGYYVCIGYTMPSSCAELHQFNLVQTTTPPTLQRINYIMYSNYWGSGGNSTPLIAIQSNIANTNIIADYVVTLQGAGTGFMYFFNVNSGNSGQTWGTLTKLPIVTYVQIDPSNTSQILYNYYYFLSITIDYQNNLHVLESSTNNIYSYALNSNCNQIASTENGNNIFGGVALNFNTGSSNYPAGLIAASQGGSIVVADMCNKRILTLVVSNGTYILVTNTPFFNTYNVNLIYATLTYPYTIGEASSLAIAFDTNGLFLASINPYENGNIVNTTQNNLVIYNNISLTSLLIQNVNSSVRCSGPPACNIAIDSNGNILYNPVGDSQIFYGFAIAMKGS